MRYRPAVLATLLLALLAPQARAQTGERAPYRRVIAVQPLWILVNVYSADYEQAVGKGGLSLGANVSYNPRNPVGWLFLEDRTEYFSSEAKLRYYPEQRGLHGVSLGVGLGVIHTDSHSFLRDEATQRRTRPSLGFELAYSSTVSAESHLQLSAGFGIKRRLGRRLFDEAGITLPLRLAIGYAF